MSDRVWNSLPTRRLRAFGSALPPHVDKRIETPALITERPMRMRGSPPCPQCGNSGRFHCACEIEESTRDGGVANNAPPTNQ